MNEQYQHLGSFSDWAAVAQQMRPLYPSAPPGRETQKRILEVLGFAGSDEMPTDVQVERRWQRDGLLGEEISWSVGYGPRTRAWLLKPEQATTPLPALVALHDHGGFKFYGKEKIADGWADPEPVIRSFRANAYGDRAFANELARQGYVVLIPDTFMWGSRRFPFENMPQSVQGLTELTTRNGSPDASTETPSEISKYNTAAGLHEHIVLEKYCTLLGTTMAGMVSHEDRMAVNYLRTRPDVSNQRIGAIGLSGGGCRSALLQATCDHVRAAVVVGMMSTYEALLDHNIVSHTWMFFPTGWARYGDWPDLAACRAPSPLLVQYDREDTLFTLAGMQAAHEKIAAHYRAVGYANKYTGQFYPGPHKFDVEMQSAAFAWLKENL